MINKIKITSNTFIVITAVLNIVGLLFVLLSIVYLTPLTLIFSLVLGAPLIFISLLIFIVVVILDERKRRITQ
jgi:hypothetical protein